MSTLPRHAPDAVESSALGRRKLHTTLKSHVVLTRASLSDLSHAGNWPVPFDLALVRATHSGRVTRLGEDLFEAGPGED